MNNKILVIEDDKTLLDSLRNILQEEDFKVVTAEDGETGIKKAKEWEPDLIICDIALPKKDGYGVLEEISKIEKTKRIPFVFLTAKVERNDLRKGMRLGADDYIFKPFDISDLLDSIRLRITKKNNQLSEPNKNESRIQKANYKMEDQILLNYGGKPHLCSVKNIKYLRAETPYVKIKFRNGKSLLQRDTLNNWDEKLPSQYFVRIHRATIINTDFITKIEKLGKVAYLIKLEDEDDPFVVSKRARAKFKKKYS